MLVGKMTTLRKNALVATTAVLLAFVAAAMGAKGGCTPGGMGCEPGEPTPAPIAPSPVGSGECPDALIEP